MFNATAALVASKGNKATLAEAHPASCPGTVVMMAINFLAWQIYVMMLTWRRSEFPGEVKSKISQIQTEEN